MGLDIYVYEMKKVDQTKKWKGEQIGQKYPEYSMHEFDKNDLHDVPEGFSNFAFEVDCPVISYVKMLELTSTPEHPRKWSDGWQWGGTCSSPWDDKVPLDENAKCYIHFVRYDPDPEKKDEKGCHVMLDQVWIPVTPEVEEKCLDRATYTCILHGEEKGCQRKGMRGEFYDFISKRGCSWVFSLKDLRKIKKMAESPAEFQHNIIDNFVEGEDGVWFWY